MSAVMVADDQAVGDRVRLERKAVKDAEDAAWRANHAVHRAQEQAELRARLSAKQHARARRLGEARLLELRRLLVDLEPHLAVVERRLRLLREFERSVYAEFTDKYGEPVGEQLFVDHVGHDVVGEVRERLEQAAE